MTNQKKLLLIDGSSVAFRAFFALYNQIDRFRNNNGLHTNAIYGFHLMLDNLLERIQPTHVLVAFDAGKTTFRTEMFADYKAGRAYRAGMCDDAQMSPEFLSGRSSHAE